MYDANLNLEGYVLSHVQATIRAERLGRGHYLLKKLSTKIFLRTFLILIKEISPYIKRAGMNSKRKKGVRGRRGMGKRHDLLTMCVVFV